MTFVAGGTSTWKYLERTSFVASDTYKRTVFDYSPGPCREVLHTGCVASDTYKRTVFDYSPDPCREVPHTGRGLFKCPGLGFRGFRVGV